ncbi:hypothetical protein P608_17420 [Comamonas thiooxydans]|uniref:Uncharacterized protein n=1 Tax=Comamonas thiooxydans TaxID=363952 RepID=A0A0E3BYI2_9BURK|nr:hypothetical protein P608_17420 [Comamonas thiooxydans]KGH15339.1 hypothetical protein P607_22150 [Comamonas thiooxydans]KGH20507.1 hypothetical protein P606_20930 [Comamonas thiooxydans]
MKTAARDMTHWMAGLQLRPHTGLKRQGPGRPAHGAGWHKSGIGWSAPRRELKRAAKTGAARVR